MKTTTSKDAAGNVTILAEFFPGDIDPLELLLKRDTAVQDAKECDVLHTFTFDFGGKIEADIKVCNGDTGPWVDSVLFLDGSEIQCLEPSDQLEGEYPFDYNGVKYTINIVRLPF